MRLALRAGATDARWYSNRRCPTSGWSGLPGHDQERAAREAHAIRTHAALSDRVCALTYYDEDNHVLALEDLTDHIVLRGYLDQGNDIAGVPEILGRHVADIAYGTSFVAVGEEVFRLAAADAVNTELCALTEDVIFTEPFLGSDRNSLQYPEAERFVADLQHDRAWIAGAMRCKRRFLTVAEALVHGDLHTGSVFVRFDGREDGAPGTDGWSVKTFDPEFSYYGPIGFDLGLLCANFVMAAARADVLGEHDRRNELIDAVPQVWASFEARLRALYAGRAQPGNYPDEFLDAWLADIATDTTGFTGCEIARRIIGLAKVSDLESLDRAGYLRATERSLEDAIVTLTNLADGADMVRRVFGDDVIVVPYTMPGFDLARAVADLWDEQAHPGTIGLALLNHGLFTVGVDTREAYERHIGLLDRAERYLAEHALVADPSRLKSAIPMLERPRRGPRWQRRGRTDDRLPAHRRSVAGFVARPDLAEVSTRGPATPDHIIRTKRIPVGDGAPTR